MKCPEHWRLFELLLWQCPTRICQAQVRYHRFPQWPQLRVRGVWVRDHVRRVYDDVEVRLLENVEHSPHFESPEETNRFTLEWAMEKKIVA